MNIVKNICSKLLILFLLFLLTACAQTQPSSQIDYGDQNRWISKPENADKPVDILYFYPTVWAKEEGSSQVISEIDDDTLIEGAKSAFEKQATAFETAGNLYAPYYRQADAAYCLNASEQEHYDLLNGTPKQDIFAALDYYFANENDDRPFILAGHSQGSNMLLYVLSEYMKKHPEVYKNMVAAYVIGYSVTDGFLKANPHLKFAQGADDTGVIISYNTESPGVACKNPVLEDGALVINPITWTRTQDTAEAAQSLGSNIDGTKVKGYADAKVNAERGVVVCSTVDPDDYYKEGSIFPRGVLHGLDYPLYYYDIRANAELRANNFLKENDPYAT